MTLSFRTYIHRRRIASTAAGDFIADAKVDPNLPNATTWQELRNYLVDSGASENAIKAGRIVWRGYLAARRNARSL